MRKGSVSASDFVKVLKEVFQELLTDEQAEEMQSHYLVHDNPNSCNWPKFLHDAEKGNADLMDTVYHKIKTLKKERKKHLISR